MVCDGEICELERRTQAEMQAWFATKKRSTGMGANVSVTNSSDLDMSFEAFTELYIKDVKNRLKENTWLTKEHIIRTKILPYFGKLKISEISTKEIITWQNEMLAYRDEKKKPYSQTYLKTLHNQLSAIFNHAVRYYECVQILPAKVGNMGSEEHKEMLFWTRRIQEILRFEMMDKPVSFYAFEMLYWCGIREGELLALTAADFDFDKETVTINKSYQRLHGEDVITTPKTKKSNRIIKMPKFLCEEMQEYMQYALRSEKERPDSLRSQKVIFITRWTEGESRRREAYPHSRFETQPYQFTD